ncbi:MAG: hypothetical protein ACOC0N_11655, partial [Chroococcales cyanobacterium]
FDSEHPEWRTGQWREVTIPDYPIPYPACFQWATVDTNQVCWFSGAAVSDGSLIREGYDLGNHSLSEDDRIFVDRIHNLIVNVLLVLETCPDLMSNVTSTETIAKPKGFGIAQKQKAANIRYPRWLGKSYKRTVNATPRKHHASPRTHWRRGHWRSLEGQHWKQNKRVWIKPVLVRASISE